MACSACDPTLRPTGPRRPGLYAIRFDDWSLTVHKDGQRIDDCYEVDAHSGRAWRYAIPVGACACGEGVEAYIDTGQFTVELAESSRP